MNRDEHILNRLLQAARRSRPETPEAMPFSTEARILAGWRSSAPEGEASLPARFFQRAAICAVLIMVASIGWTQLSDVHEVPGAVAFSNLAKDIQIVP